MYTHTAPSDLDVQGTPCVAIVSVVNLPQPDLNCPVQRLRRDVFVLCDMRPLGLRPFAFHTHSLMVHIPTILALARIRVPTGFNLLIEGGVVEGDEVRVSGSTTLTFRTQPVSGADSPASAPPPPSDPSDGDDDSHHGHDDTPPSTDHSDSSSHAWPALTASASGDPIPDDTVPPPSPDAAGPIMARTARSCGW